MNQYLVLILSIIAIESIVEIIVSSELFMSFRNMMYKVSSKIGTLFSCGYCLSVWISVPFSLFLIINISGIYILDVLIKIFILSRLSNIFHELLSRWFNRHPFVIMLNVNKNNENQIDDEINTLDNTLEKLDNKLEK